MTNEQRATIKDLVSREIEEIDLYQTAFIGETIEKQIIDLDKRIKELVEERDDLRDKVFQRNERKRKLELILNLLEDDNS
jgi:hypothetical protein